MKKTSVYLTDEEADGLRRASVTTGRSQAQLIRDAVRQIVAAEDSQRRVFRSLGKGHGGGPGPLAWEQDGLYCKVMGRE